jgi:hypothetical protein
MIRKQHNTKQYNQNNDQKTAELKQYNQNNDQKSTKSE